MTPALRKPVLVFAGVLVLLGGAAAYRTWFPAHGTTPVAPVAAPPAASFREAFVEIAVATQLPEAALAEWEDRKKLQALLATFAPGGAGEAGRLRSAAEAMLQSEQSSAFEVMSAERFILPPATDAELIAPGLSPEERARFFASTSVLVLRLRGSGGPPHFVARIGFGLATAIAERTQGFVEDEVRRRVETPALVKARSVLPDVRSAFNDESISIELDPNADPSKNGRLLSLGMRRYGAPDLLLQDVPTTDAVGLSRALTALCRIAAEKPLSDRLSIEPEELRTDGSARATGAAFEVRFAPAPMAAGNPENEVLEVTLPADAKTRLARQLELDATEGAGLHAESDDELRKRLETVQRTLPTVLARWKKERGDLFVLVDFSAKEGNETAVESMWVHAAAVEPGARVRGMLANEPAHVPGLHHGEAVDVAQPVVSGYRLELPSGERVAFP